MSNRTKGIICILLAALSFATMSTFVRLAGDVPSMQKAFFRNFVAVIFSFCIMIKHRIPFHPPEKKHWPLLFARAAFGTLGLLCNFYAVDHLNLSDASMLNKMSPFFAIIVSYFLLNEHLALYQGVGVIAAFLGSLLIIKPNPANMALFPSLIGLQKGRQLQSDCFRLFRLLLPDLSALLYSGPRAHVPFPMDLPSAGRHLRLHRPICHHFCLPICTCQGDFRL